MKKAFAVGVFILGLSTIAMAADYYKLTMVKRIDNNLYSAYSGGAKVVVKTRYCYHYSYGEDAILKFEPYASDNKIIFDDNETCDVDTVFKG